MAGPTPPFGNSLAEEDQFLLENPALRSNVWRLDSVTDEEKTWLYERASLVLYPTGAEGFGLVPFEAAAHGVPCLSTRAGSLDEVLPADLPTIQSGDFDGAASLAVAMASSPEMREQVCNLLLARAAEFDWPTVAQRLVRRADGNGRIPALEIMVANGRIRQCIADPSLTSEIEQIVGDGEYYGMLTFDQSLANLLQDGLVTLQEALMVASNPHDLRVMLERRGLVATGSHW